MTFDNKRKYLRKQQRSFPWPYLVLFIHAKAYFAKAVDCNSCVLHFLDIMIENLVENLISKFFSFYKVEDFLELVTISTSIPD